MEVPKLSIIRPVTHHDPESGEVQGFSVTVGGEPIPGFFPVADAEKFQDYVHGYRWHNARVRARIAGYVGLPIGLIGGAVYYASTQQESDTQIIDATQSPTTASTPNSETMPTSGSTPHARPSSGSKPTPKASELPSAPGSTATVTIRPPKHTVFVPQPTETVTVPGPTVTLPPKPSEVITAAPNPADFGDCTVYKLKKGDEALVCINPLQKQVDALSVETKVYESVDTLLASVSSLLGHPVAQPVAAKYALDTKVAAVDLHASKLIKKDPTEAAQQADMVRLTETVAAIQAQKPGLAVLNHLDNRMLSQLNSQLKDAYAIFSSPVGEGGVAIIADRDRFVFKQGGSYSSPGFDGEKKDLPLAHFQVKGTETKENPAGHEVVIAAIQSPEDNARYPHEAADRAAALNIQQDLAFKLAKNGATVLFAGDTGSQPSAYYQDTTESGLLVNAADNGSEPTPTNPPADLDTTVISGTNNVNFGEYAATPIGEEQAANPLITAHAVVPLDETAPTIPEPPVAPVEPTKTDPTAVSLDTLNVYVGNSEQEQHDDIQTMIESKFAPNPDVVALTEAYKLDGWAPKGYQFVGQRDGTHDQRDTALLVRNGWRVKDWGLLRLADSQLSKRVDGGTRYSTWALIDDGTGHTMLDMAVHMLQAPKGSVRREVYSQQIHTLADFVAKQPSDLAVAVLGDFNKSFQQDSAEQSPRFPFVALGKVGVHSLYELGILPDNGMDTGDKNRSSGPVALDYLFVRSDNGLLVPSAQHIEKGLKSDHNGLAAKLRLFSSN